MSTITETQAGIPTGTFAADGVHSTLVFEVPYAVSTFRGEVPQFEAKLEDGRLSGAAQISSIKVKEENLEAHLLSPEFFDADRHPVVSFAGDLERTGENTVRVTGEITIKGITQPAVLEGTIVGPAVDHFGATRVGLDLTTVIDRTAFGMTWNMPLPNGQPALANDVTLNAHLTLVAQEA
jgi:polyisoprenoid-binding protein YceI